MDLVVIKEKGAALFKKYKFVLLVLLVGIILMCLPSQDPNAEETPPQAITVMDSKTELQEQISDILSMVEGAGKVKVMLTVSVSEQKIFQEDIQSDTVKTVIISDDDRNESGLIKQINSPKYQGAIILCQGADDPNVKLSVVEAVSRLTGLGADQIAVLKMN